MPLPQPLDPAALLEQSRWVHSLVRGLIREEALVEDVVQETWLAALERRPAFDHAGGPRAWLARVARNLALRARRRELVRRAVERGGARSEGTAGGEDAVERMQLQEKLAAAVLALEEPYRTAILLRHVDGHSHAEVARRQGCTPAAARQRVGRGLAQLRARLAREFEDRESWCLALVRLAAGGNGGVLAAGGVLMGTKLFVAAGGCAVLAALWWGLAAERGAGPAAAEPSARLAQPEVKRPDAELERVTGAPLASTPAADALRRQVHGSIDDLGQVYGLVTDTRGRPLAGAVVVSSTGAQAAGLPVGADGRFSVALSDSAAARLDLTVTCAGYVAERAEGVAGQELVVALRTLPALEGVLVDEEGVPVAPPGKVVATLEAAVGSESERECELESDGTFSLRELPPGRVTRLWARARGFVHRELEPDLALVPDRVQRMEIELPAGAVVTGVVVDEATREPIPGARVWLEEREFGDERSLHPATVADEHGRFRLAGAEVEPYKTSEHDFVIFHLVGDAPGYLPSPARGYGSTPNDPPEYEFELALTRGGASLELALRRPDGSPARSVQVFLADSQGNHGFHESDASGRFTRENLPAGLVALRFNGGGLHGSVDLELEAGALRREEIELSADRASIHGRVTDTAGRPLRVELTLNQHLVAPGIVFAFELRTIKSDANGEYAFAELPAGTFEFRPQTDECSLPSRAKIELRDGESRQADFVLGQCLVVGGRVESEETAPELLALELRDARTGEVVATASPAADGSFCLDPRFEGEYDLVLLLEGTELDRTSVGPARSAGIVLRAR